MFLVIIIFHLANPIVLGTFLGTTLPISVIAIFFSLIYFIFSKFCKEKLWLLLSMGMGFISILATSLFIYNSLNLRAFISFMYFFSSTLLFFSGYNLIKESKDIIFVVRWLSRFFVLAAIWIFFSIKISGDPVRIMEGVLNVSGSTGASLSGNLYGLELYGAWGVNTLAVFYVVMCSVVLTYCLRLFTNKDYIELFLCIVGVLFLGYMITKSISVQAIFGFFLFCFFFLYREFLFGRRVEMVGLFFFFFALVGCFVFVFHVGLDGIDLAPKFQRKIDALLKGDFVGLTSNRVLLWKDALSDLFHIPFLGTGFRGFEAFGAAVGVGRVSQSGAYTPHNFYITIVWKMGLFAAVFYFLFLLKCYVNLFFMYKSFKSFPEWRGIWGVMLVYALIFNMVWDTFQVPLHGALAMFLFGVASKSRKMSIIGTYRKF